MLVAFELSMPGKGSWNGNWSGEGRSYVRVCKIPNKLSGKCTIDEVLQKNRFTYRWNDGWCALVEVRRVDHKEAAKLRKKSVGFCGYDWMIDSILEDGDIRIKE